MKKIFNSLFLVSILLLLSACNHKELTYGSAEAKEVWVVFDWKDAPEANPASMALYLYPTDGGIPLRYEFSGRDGGKIRVPFGMYDALCMNSDNTSWIHSSETGSRYTFGLHVGELTSASEDQGEYAAILKQSGKMEDGNPVDENPRGLWTGSLDAYEIKTGPGKQTLTLVPEDALCYYTVDVLDIDNFEELEAEEVPAILTGMSDGVDALSRNSSTIHVSSPFILQKVSNSESRADNANSLHAEFNTFGEDAGAMLNHKVDMMVQLADGSWNLQTANVTEQVRNAPDSRHVHIVIRGFKVPEESSGGLKVDVDEWESENITLKM